MLDYVGKDVFPTSLLARWSCCSLLYFCFCKGVRTAVLHQFQLQIKLVIGCRVGAMKLSICVLTQFEPERMGKPRSAEMLQTRRPRAFVEGYF